MKPSSWYGQPDGLRDQFRIGSDIRISSFEREVWVFLLTTDTMTSIRFLKPKIFANCEETETYGPRISMFDVLARLLANDAASDD